MQIGVQLPVPYRRLLDKFMSFVPFVMTSLIINVTNPITFHEHGQIQCRVVIQYLKKQGLNPKVIYEDMIKTYWGGRFV